MLAPFGVGVLYAKEHLAASSLPFLYGGDMIAEGRVFPDRVGTTRCPGARRRTPNILGAIACLCPAAAADLASPRHPAYFGTGKPIARSAVKHAMDRVAA
jgi:cysteine desulfurase/selenocysteine lyase